MSVPAFLLSTTLPASAEPEQTDEIAVTVQKSGETVIVDVDFFVQATQREAWDVLTDFDHMPRFISNLQSSKVIDRSGDKLQVSQQGKASRGLLSFSFDSMREIKLKPYQEIHTRAIGGNIKKMEGVTQLFAEGLRTRIVYHGESIPNVWVPPGIGTTFIKNEVREQFLEMRGEILRRKEQDRK